MEARKTRDMTVTAVMAAVLCCLGPLTIQIGPIPVTLANLGVMLAAYVLGRKRSAAAVGLYLLIGLVGLPVFSGFQGGPQKLLGPTGGFLAGYLLLAFIAGWCIDRWPESRLAGAAGLLAGEVVLYILGTAWFVFQAGTGVGEALALCVYPFLAVDAAKVVAATAVGPVLRAAVRKSGALD